MIDIPWCKYYTKLRLRDVLSFIVFIFLMIKKRISGNRDVGIRILVYHSINEIDRKKDKIRITVSPELFCKQMDYLSFRGYNIVSLDSIVDCILGKKEIAPNSIALTFDDGFKDNYKYGYDILKAKGFPAVYFLTYDYIGSNRLFPWCVDNSSCAAALAWDDVQAMASGGMSIGSHTLSHADLGAIAADEDRLYNEIKLSKGKIEERLNIAVDYFAYPVGNRGAYNSKTEEIIRRSGYKAAFTNVFGANKKGANIFELKRTRIDWNDTLFRFRMKLEGAYDWVDYA